MLAWQPGNFAQRYINVTRANHASVTKESGMLYDFAWSFSSFEHDGLGRYGDPLSPYGDLEAIMKVHCVLPVGGLFFLGLGHGKDAVVWNAHRVYGAIR